MEWIGPPVGTWLIFGIILVPLYGMLLGWFLGKPYNFRVVLIGVAYLVGMVTILWGGLTVLAWLIGLVFF